MIRNINNTMSLNTGVKGSFGGNDDWSYEANFEHAQNTVSERVLRIRT